MVIDISAHLRRLVLAGLPLLASASACQTYPLDGSTPPEQPLVTGASCRPRMIVDLGAASHTGATVISAQVGFDLNDPRVSDLYVSCTIEGDYCGRLCQELLTHARPSLKVPPDHVLSSPQACELRCDAHGRPVVRLAYSSFHPGVPGRRPEGFAGAASARPGTCLASYLADCARLEGASITAFVVLGRELEHHGAPAALIDRARLAARDETRHFAQTSRLARLFGSPAVRCPRPARRPLRPLAAVARENVVEGCVNETFAAALALWQAARAEHPAVRGAMAAIAEDEVAHAQLAWDIHDWATTRLPPAVTADLHRAREQAGRQLWADSDAPVDPRLVAQAGLPPQAAARGLAERAQALWSARVS
jgi:hypothetical protein